MRTAEAQPIEATMPIAVTLQAQQWNSVIALIADGPYRVAAPLITAIAQQTQAIATGFAARGNGEFAERPSDPS